MKSKSTRTPDLNASWRLALLLFFISISAITNAQILPGCNAQFTYSANSSAGNGIHFTPAQNSNAATYSWNFGDGSAPVMQMSPTHVYNHPGAYWACLTVTVPASLGTVACTASWCDSVHVYGTNPVCNAGFTFTMTATNDSVRFNTLQNTNNTTYAWDFGDGTNSNLRTPIHHFAIGSYWVCLTVTQFDVNGVQVCSNQHCDSVRVQAPHYNCNAHYTWLGSNSAGTINIGDSIRFYGGQNLPGTTYSWDFGDGTNSNIPNPAHHFPQPGAYWVCLTVTLNSTTGGPPLCTDTYCDSVHVVPPHYNCNARFSAYRIQHTDSMHFYPAANATGTTYAWDFGDGGTSADHSPIHGYSSTGTYWVCLTVTTLSSTGSVLCTDHHCDSIRVLPPPPPPPPCDAHFRHIAGFGLNGVLFLPNMFLPGVSYSWDFGDGSSSTQGFTVHNYAQPGTYWACLTITRVDTAGNQICTATWCDSVNTNRIFPFPINHLPGNPFFQLSTLLSENNSIEQSEKNSNPGLNLDQEATAVIYPNPVASNSVLYLQNTDGNITLRIYDNTGRLISLKQNLGNGENFLDLNNYQSGIYFYQVSSMEKMIVTGKMIVE